ncbi:hypothetical protein, partial [Streptomyces sp. NPDC088348]|uniref:WXG100 family type VII secretion target n=1 Tax=Streptomyces sp. NPDC088348 TaxID=3365853 RepID=UPI00382A5968
MTESSTSYNTGGDGGYTYEAVPGGYGTADGYPPPGTETVPDSYTNGYDTGSYGLDSSAYGATPGSDTYGVDGGYGSTVPTGYDTGYGTTNPTGYDTGYGSGGYGTTNPTGYDTGYGSGGYGTTNPTGYDTGYGSTVPTTTTTPATTTTTTDPGSETDSGSTTGSGSETDSDSTTGSDSETDSDSTSGADSTTGSDSDSNFDSTGDYTDWTWKQVMAHVTGYNPDDTSVNGSLTSSPQSMQDAADVLWYTGQVLKEAGENLDAQVESLAGENGSWQGAAAQSFYSLMKNLSQQVSNLTGVLTGGITGDNNVPQQLADNAQHLRDAINKLIDIDNWYGKQAVAYYNDHLDEFDEDIIMDNGQIAVSQVKAIPPMMDSDMRAVLVTLAGHYRVTIDQVPKATFSNPMTGSGNGLSGQPTTGQTGLGTPLQPVETSAISPYGALTPGVTGGATSGLTSYASNGYPLGSTVPVDPATGRQSQMRTLTREAPAEATGRESQMRTLTREAPAEESLPEGVESAQYMPVEQGTPSVPATPTETPRYQMRSEQVPQVPAVGDAVQGQGQALTSSGEALPAGETPRYQMRSEQVPQVPAVGDAVQGQGQALTSS